MESKIGGIFEVKTSKKSKKSKGATSAVLAAKEPEPSTLESTPVLSPVVPEPAVRGGASVVAGEVVVGELVVEVASPKPSTLSAAGGGVASGGKAWSEVVAGARRSEKAPDVSTPASRCSPLDFATSSRNGVEVWRLEAGTSCANATSLASFPPVQGVEGVAWSPEGRWLGMLSDGVLRVIDASDDYNVFCELHPLDVEDIQGLRGFHFSPLGNFVACFEPPSDDPRPNLGVWRIDTAPEMVMALECSAWPAMKWTDDERWCCHMARDELQVYEGDVNLEQGTPKAAIACEGVSSFELARSTDGDVGHVYVATFVPRRRGDTRAWCSIYQLSEPTKPVVTKELPQVDSASMRWNFSGTALLLLTSTDVDSNNKSYYGSTALFLLRADGSLATSIQIGESGVPVHDVAWCPAKDEFLLLQGDLPCTATLHDGKQAAELLDFGKSRKNIVRWSPMGRFFALGGFGQLAGDIDFWDLPSKNLVGQTRYPCCVDCQWSPDGRNLLGWTIAPRMRVENRIEIFDYTGNRILKIDFEELLAASWRPSLLGSHEDRPPTPRLGAEAQSGQSRATKAAYKPPNSSGTLSAWLRAEEEGGTRTTARTAAERAADVACRTAVEDSKKSRASQNLRYVDVPVPADLVARLIGTKGISIKELRDMAGVSLTLRAIPSSSSSGAAGSTVIRIGPPRPFEDIDKAEVVVREKVKELSEERQARKQLVREVIVPNTLVPKFIGSQGGNIQTLTKQIGLPLRVRDMANKEEGSVVVIGPSRRSGVEAEEELAEAVQAVEANLQELEQMVQERDRKVVVSIPDQLVGGVFGYKRATIEELSRQAGVPMRVQFARTKGNEPNEGSKVIIGPGAPDAMNIAKELLAAKVEELRAADSAKGSNSNLGCAKTNEQWSSQGSWWDKSGSGSWEKEKDWKGGHWVGQEDWKDWGSWHDEKVWKTNDKESLGWKSRETSERNDKEWKSRSTADDKRWAEPSPLQREPSSSSKREEPPSLQKPAAEAAADAFAAIRAEAQAAVDAGNFEEAIKLFTKAVRAPGPGDPVALAGRSAAYISLGKGHEAFRDATLAVRLRPEWAEAHLRKGLAMQALGHDYEPVLREAYRLDPNCDAARVALGMEALEARGPMKEPQALSKEPRVLLFSCADCNVQAEWGATDPSNGLWYCRSCWDALEDDEEEGEEEKRFSEPEQKEEEEGAGAEAEEGGLLALTSVSTPKERPRWADEEVGDEFMESLPERNRSSKGSPSHNGGGGSGFEVSRRVAKGDSLGRRDDAIRWDRDVRPDRLRWDGDRDRGRGGKSSKAEDGDRDRGRGGKSSKAEDDDRDRGRGGKSSKAEDFGWGSKSGRRGEVSKSSDGVRGGRPSQARGGGKGGRGGFGVARNEESRVESRAAHSVAAVVSMPRNPFGAARPAASLAPPT